MTDGIAVQGIVDVVPVGFHPSPACADRQRLEADRRSSSNRRRHVDVLEVASREGRGCACGSCVSGGKGGETAAAVGARLSGYVFQPTDGKALQEQRARPYPESAQSVGLALAACGEGGGQKGGVGQNDQVVTRLGRMRAEQRSLVRTPVRKPIVEMPTDSRASVANGTQVRGLFAAATAARPSSAASGQRTPRRLSWGLPAQPARARSNGSGEVRRPPMNAVPSVRSAQETIMPFSGGRTRVSGDPSLRCSRPSGAWIVGIHASAILSKRSR